MSATTNVNKWAPKLVVLVQLAIWSVVGILLVQKGAITLRENIEERGEPEEIQISQGTPSDSKDEPPPRVDPASTRRAENRHRVLRHRATIPFSSNENATADDGVVAEQPSSVSTSNESKHAHSPANRIEVSSEKARRKNVSASAPEFFLENADQNVAARAESNNKTLNLSPINPAGAAAAIAMLAIGVLMLLLGPAIVILRALDARRRERRFSKLTSRRDLPPSYEQATLMDQAPRYSTLRLNNANPEESRCFSSTSAFREIVLFFSTPFVSTTTATSTPSC